MAKKATVKNFDQVLDNLKAWFHENVKGHKPSEKAFFEDFNNLLDKMASDDAFGTEGQLDPRGDQRSNGG